MGLFKKAKKGNREKIVVKPATQITEKKTMPRPYEPPKLPDFDIPRVSYKKTDKAVIKEMPDPEKEFLKAFKKLARNHRGYDVWADFVVMSACAISNAVDRDKAKYEERENRYLQLIKKYSPDEQQIFPELMAHLTMALEFNPEQDFLGKLYTELDLYDRGRDQFFTPYHICQLMADISIGDEQLLNQVEEDDYITIHDPCCGAGATLIAGVYSVRKTLEKENLNFQNHVLVSGQDIDEIVALMCYLQLSLLGVAAYIKVGNSFTDPMTEGDTLENYWFTPMYFMDVWPNRRTIQKIRETMKYLLKEEP